MIGLQQRLCVYADRSIAVLFKGQ